MLGKLKAAVQVSGMCSQPNWHINSQYISERRKIKKLICISLSCLSSLPPQEADFIVDAVENELFYQANSVDDYLDNETVFDRISATSWAKLNDYNALKPKKNVCLAEASNLTESQFNSGLSLQKQSWAEHPASTSNYCQDPSGAIVKYDRSPHLTSYSAIRQASPVDSSSGCEPCFYPAHPVASVGPSNLNAPFSNHSLPPDGGSVWSAQGPYGLLFNNNLHGNNTVNDLNNPSREQPGKCQPGRRNGPIIHATPRRVDTYQTGYFPYAPPSGPPYKRAFHGEWTGPLNGNRGRERRPCGNNTSVSVGTSGGDNFLRQCDVPRSSMAVHGDQYQFPPYVTPCGSSRLSNSPHFPIAGAVRGGGKYLQEAKQPHLGPTFGNYSSESAPILPQLNSNGQSGTAPVRGIIGENISHDHEAPLNYAAPFGVNTPVSHASNFPRFPFVGTVNDGEVRLQSISQAENYVSPGKYPSQGEGTVRQIHSVEQSGTPVRRYSQDLQNVSNNTRDCEPVMEDLPDAVASIGGSSDVMDLLKKHCDDDCQLVFPHLNESHFPDIPEPNEPAVIDPQVNDESQPHTEVKPVHLEELPRFSSVDDSKICPPPKECVPCRELKFPVEIESMDVDEVTLIDNLEVSSFFEVTIIPNEDEDTRAQTDGSKAPVDEILETENVNGKGMKTETSNPSPVSVTECMSEEQLLEHLSSLRNFIGKGSGEGEEEEAGSSSENICQTCRKEKMFFEPAPCTGCGTKIKKNVAYYSPLGEEDGLKLCLGCYKLSGKKQNLRKRITKEGAGEKWVQCDKCQGWQHQICTLYNQQRDKGGKGQYTCPLCCIQEIKSGDRLPSEGGLLKSRNLPRTALSDHIEQRLQKSLTEERQVRAIAEGKGLLDVPGAEDLTVRVVLTEKKNLKVKGEFLGLFNTTNYPSDIPYTSKMVLVFQKIGVVDVIIFGFYTQEYGSDCDDPNRRWIYISYIDSIKYFRPSVVTATGEALRTFIYHEILIGYLDHCKNRGFVSCHLWSCPPGKELDYLFYRHPGNQRTPTSSKLKDWYQAMIQKAVEQKVVVSHSNIYDYHFRTSNSSRYQVSATRLPYFEGDSWFNFSKAVLEEVAKESKSNYKRKRDEVQPKKKTKTSHCKDTLDDFKDFLFMQKLGKILQKEKKNFIVMHLRHVCSHCHQAIASGQAWFCNGCADLRLCERCHEDDNSIAESHQSNEGEEHFCSKVAVDRLPLSTDDEDGCIESNLLVNRLRFLKFCQDNHYQFDTLRRAKYSSMMVLHFLSNPDDSCNCSICSEASLTSECWTCEICPDFHVCSLCHDRKCFSHNHPLTLGSDS